MAVTRDERSTFDWMLSRAILRSGEGKVSETGLRSEELPVAGIFTVGTSTTLHSLLYHVGQHELMMHSLRQKISHQYRHMIDICTA